VGRLAAAGGCARGEQSWAEEGQTAGVGRPAIWLGRGERKAMAGGWWARRQSTRGAGLDLLLLPKNSNEEQLEKEAVNPQISCDFGRIRSQKLGKV
jgi:hypothetical protein